MECFCGKHHYVARSVGTSDKSGVQVDSNTLYREMAKPVVDSQSWILFSEPQISANQQRSSKMLNLVARVKEKIVSFCVRKVFSPDTLVMPPYSFWHNNISRIYFRSEAFIKHKYLKYT